jgi:hypothetical protein
LPLPNHSLFISSFLHSFLPSSVHSFTLTDELPPHDGVLYKNDRLARQRLLRSYKFGLADALKGAEKASKAKRDNAGRDNGDDGDAQTVNDGATNGSSNQSTTTSMTYIFGELVGVITLARSVNHYLPSAINHSSLFHSCLALPYLFFSLSYFIFSNLTLPYFTQVRDMGFDSLSKSIAWVSIVLTAAAFWMRMYIRYVGQYFFLRLANIDVRTMTVFWYGVDLDYGPQVSKAIQFTFIHSFIIFIVHPFNHVCGSITYDYGPQVSSITYLVQSRMWFNHVFCSITYVVQSRL